MKKAQRWLKVKANNTVKLPKDFTSLIEIHNATEYKIVEDMILLSGVLPKYIRLDYMTNKKLLHETFPNHEKK